MKNTQCPIVWYDIVEFNVLPDTKNKETKHYIHPKHKRQTEKTALINKINYTLTWYTSYDLHPRKGPSPILTAPKPAQGTGMWEMGFAGLSRSQGWKNEFKSRF